MTFLENNLFLCIFPGRNNYNYCLGNLINPRYRGNTLKKLDIYDDFVKGLIESHPSTQAFVEEMQSKSLEKNTDEIDLDANIDSADFYHMMAVNDGFDPHKIDDPNNSQNMPDLERELKSYLALPPVSIDDSKKALDWWKAHRRSLPLLAELARNVLCIPVASASSERVFSASGNIITDKRHNLTPENAKKLTLIKVNYEYISNYIELQVSNPEEPQEDSLPTPTSKTRTQRPKDVPYPKYTKYTKYTQPHVPKQSTSGTQKYSQPQEPMPSTSGTQKAKQTPRKQTPRKQKGFSHRELCYSSSTDSVTTSDMEPPPEPASQRRQIPCSPPKPKRVTRRSTSEPESTSESESESQSLIKPPSKKRLRKASLSASDILEVLNSESSGSPVQKRVKESRDMFEDLDDDVRDPSFLP